MDIEKHRNWHQHVVSILESLNYQPLLTDPSCLRNDEFNINIFIHVDDGLLFCTRLEVLQLVELVSKQILMRIVGRMQKTGRQNLLSRQSHRENGSWILGGGESEVHPRRD